MARHTAAVAQWLESVADEKLARGEIDEIDESAASHEVITVDADGSWHRVSSANHENAPSNEWILAARERAFGDLPAMESFARLMTVLDRARELGLALSRGEDVADQIGALYRAATGRQSETEDRRRILIAVAHVARRSDEHWSVVLGRPVRDSDLAHLVLYQIEVGSEQLATRLSNHPHAIARAVKLWRRGAGRPRKGEPTGSKWEALATLIRFAKLGNLDPKAVEQLAKEHPPK